MNEKYESGEDVRMIIAEAARARREKSPLELLCAFVVIAKSRVVIIRADDDKYHRKNFGAPCFVPVYDSLRRRGITIQEMQWEKSQRTHAAVIVDEVSVHELSDVSVIHSFCDAARASYLRSKAQLIEF